MVVNCMVMPNARSLPLRCLLAASLLFACGSSSSRDPVPARSPADTAVGPTDASPTDASAAAGDTATTAESTCGTERELAPGLLWHSAPADKEPPLASPQITANDRCLRMLRIDPSRYRLRVLTAFEHGTPRSAPSWAAEFGLLAATNTSMYRPNNRSTGLLIHDGTVNNGKDTSKFGAFLAFDPVSESDPPVAMFGRGCPGFDLSAIRARYRSIVQNYRILDCEGKAIAWKDPKLYSAAAVAMDSVGRVVFIHARTPYLMRDLANMLAAPQLGLQAAMFVEGGHEATLHVQVGDVVATLVGSYESAAGEAHDKQLDNQIAWPLPNILGVVARD